MPQTTSKPERCFTFYTVPSGAWLGPLLQRFWEYPPDNIGGTPWRIVLDQGSVSEGKLTIEPYYDALAQLAWSRGRSHWPQLAGAPPTVFEVPSKPSDLDESERLRLIDESVNFLSDLNYTVDDLIASRKEAAQFEW